MGFRPAMVEMVAQAVAQEPQILPKQAEVGLPAKAIVEDRMAGARLRLAEGAEERAQLGLVRRALLSQGRGVGAIQALFLELLQPMLAGAEALHIRLAAGLPALAAQVGAVPGQSLVSRLREGRILEEEAEVARQVAGALQELSEDRV